MLPSNSGTLSKGILPRAVVIDAEMVAVAPAEAEADPWACGDEGGIVEVVVQDNVVRDDVCGAFETLRYQCWQQGCVSVQ